MPHQVEEVQFVGAMDMDTPPQVFPKGFHSDARNIIMRGNKGNMRIDNLPGTRNIPNPYLPSTGQNKKIGAFYDDVNHRIIEFNYNSALNHGIYILNTQTETYQVLCQNGVNTNGDILGFDADIYITSVDIIYGDGNSGDLLFYIDSLYRPTKLNIQRYLANAYTPVYRSFIDVAKAPPVMPVKCTYENDLTANNNNLINSLFQFCSTNIYDDNEESVLSSGSITPLPTIAFNTVDTNPVNSNARIALYVETGDSDVKAIRIYGRQTNSGATSGWFIIATLDKASLSIPSNSIYRYQFKNDGLYLDANPSFTVVLQDYVPQQARCQALLNVSTISYANITEGYDYIKSSFTEIIGGGFEPSIYTINGCLFFAYQPKGSNQVTLYLTGVGINDGTTNLPTTLDNPPLYLFVTAKVGVTDVGFSVTNGIGNNIATIISQLQVGATYAGWSVVSSTSNSLTVSLANVVLQSAYVYLQNNIPSTIQFPSLFPYSWYSYGVVYYDDKGRTNGVITDVSANIITPSGQGYSNFFGLFYITIGLSGITPPSWAKYYHLVRTNTLTYDKYLDWISNGAYASTGQFVQSQYAYIEIDNILTYNQNLESTQNVVNYSFSLGDRVKIVGLYNAAGNFNTLNYDYEIIALVSNPIMNGIQRNGTFLQINYPTADVAASSGAFQFPGSSTFSGNVADFQNYQILIYNLKPWAQSVEGSNQNVYYETGQQYNIGFPGTSSAYHMGNTGDNEISFNDGDVFLRRRTVPTGATYQLPCNGYHFSNSYATIQIWDNNTLNDIPTTNYLLACQNNQSASLSSGGYPNFSDGNFFWNKSSNPISIRIRGTFQAYINASNTQTSVGMFLKINTSSNVATPIQVFSNQPITVINTPSTFNFDATVSIPAGCKAALIFSNYNNVGDLFISAFSMRVNVMGNYTINVYDTSFSDTYKLITNNNSRAIVQDTTALQTNFNTLFRYSEPYQLGTNINGTNRFYFNNFDEFEKQWGGVMRMKTHDKSIRIFQYRKCGVIGVYANFIKDNSGTQQLVTTDTIITPNNIQYYEGDFGIGNQGAALVSSGYADYFPDPVKGFLLRLSRDGIIPISDLYKAQSWTGNNFPPYLSNQNPYQYGGYAKILGTFFNPKDRPGEYICSAQYGAGYGINGLPVGGESLSFNEKENAFTSKYDFAPDFILCAENKLYSWFGGQTYIHDNVDAYNTFYGQYFGSEVQIIAKEMQSAKKEPLSLSYQSPYPQYNVNVPLWLAPNMGDVLTSTGQQSNLVGDDFDFREGVYHADFQRDNTGIYGVIDGNYLKGEWLQVTLRNNSNQFTFLSSLYLNYLISQRNG